jgi:hypothetical protein
MKFVVEWNHLLARITTELCEFSEAKSEKASEVSEQA